VKTRSGHSYDVVPTPLPLSYGNLRLWRADETSETQYSVPVRLTDSGAVYDNQEALDLLQLRHGGVTEPARRTQHVSGTSDVGDRIMRFVELRQVRSSSDDDDWQGPTEIGQQRDARSYVVQAPSVVDRHATSIHCRHLDGPEVIKPEVVYVNVENVATSCSQRTVHDPQAESDIEQCPGPSNGDGTAEEEHASDSCRESVEVVHGEEHFDENVTDGCSVKSPDLFESVIQQPDDRYDHRTENTSRLNVDGLSSCLDQRRARHRTSSGAPPAPLHLADAYLLRMSPPPPCYQADSRRRAAYSDPVRWVAPVSASDGGQHRRQTDTVSPTSRHGPPGRLNARPAATTCTNEALDEAIRRRNRKCKPSALRRLQAAAKAAGPETTDRFEPIFEGVTCSLRRRSASLNDCNAL